MQPRTLACIACWSLHVVACSSPDQALPARGSDAAGTFAPAGVGALGAGAGAGASSGSAAPPPAAATSGAGGAFGTAGAAGSQRGAMPMSGAASLPMGGRSASGASGSVSMAGRGDVGGSVSIAGRGSAGSAGARSFGFDTSQGWLLTVYHTPVESFHSQPAIQVTGCAKMPCANGKDDLGSYAADFVQAVKDEGNGRITSASHAGKYLNWSIDIGYWLDDGPRDARGQALVPWVSAAADPSVPYGTQFTVTDCGVDETEHTSIDATVCTAIRQAHWTVTDRFTVGAVGAQFDLYIGEEDRADFDATSPYLISAIHAQIVFGP